MKFLFRLLTRQHRQRIRELTREAWLRCQCNPDRAKPLAEIYVSEVYTGVIASLLISIAVRLAIELIKHWTENRTEFPSMEFAADEPGAFATPTKQKES